MGWKEFKEQSLSSGLGTALCVMRPSETKYHIVTAVPSLPAYAGEPNTIEYSTTTNKAISYIPGKNTTNNVEINMPYNLDNIALCKSLKGEVCKWAYIDLDNFSGGEFVGRATYRLADIEVDGVKELILTIVVQSWEEDITEDLFDLYQDTVTFNDNIPDVVHIQGTAKETIGVSTDPSSATITAESSSSAVATASYTSGSLAITGVKAGSCVVTLKATSTSEAPNSRRIKVIVE